MTVVFIAAVNCSSPDECVFTTDALKILSIVGLTAAAADQAR